MIQKRQGEAFSALIEIEDEDGIAIDLTTYYNVLACFVDRNGSIISSYSYLELTGHKAIAKVTNSQYKIDVTSDDSKGMPVGKIQMEVMVKVDNTTKGKAITGGYVVEILESAIGGAE